MTQATHSGNPALVAGVFGAAVQNIVANGRLELNHDVRQMKLASQGLHGGQNGRPDAVGDEAAAWARIREANMGDYSTLARLEGR